MKKCDDTFRRRHEGGRDVYSAFWRMGGRSVGTEEGNMNSVTAFLLLFFAALRQAHAAAGLAAILAERAVRTGVLL